MKKILYCILFMVIIFGLSACPEWTEECCMVCTTGKACGDGCISKNDKCYEGSGCACNK